MRFISNGQVWSDDQIRDFFGRQARNTAEHGFCLGALVGSDGRELLGLAGLQPLGTTADVEVSFYTLDNPVLRPQ